MTKTYKGKIVHVLTDNEMREYVPRILYEDICYELKGLRHLVDHYLSVDYPDVWLTIFQEQRERQEYRHPEQRKERL